MNDIETFKEYVDNINKAYLVLNKKYSGLIEVMDEIDREEHLILKAVYRIYTQYVSKGCNVVYLTEDMYLIITDMYGGVCNSGYGVLHISDLNKEYASSVLSKGIVDALWNNSFIRRYINAITKQGGDHG